MANVIRTGDPLGFNKDVVLSSVKVPEFKHLKKARGQTYQLKRCGNNNKDEDNSLKTFNDKNQRPCVMKQIWCGELR